MKDIEIIYFNSDSINALQDVHKYKKLVSKKKSLLFLHELYKENKLAQNKVLDQCSDKPFFCHYFQNWFQQASKESKLSTEMALLFIAMYFPDSTKWDHSIKFKSYQVAFLYHELTIENMNLLHQDGFFLKPNFFSKLTLDILDLLKIKQHFKYYNLIEKITENYLEKKPLTTIKNESEPINNPYCIFFCDTTTDVNTIKNRLRGNGSGTIISLETIKPYSHGDIQIIHFPNRDIDVVYKIIKSIPLASYDGIGVFFYWKQNSSEQFTIPKQTQVLFNEPFNSKGDLFKGVLDAIHLKAGIPKALLKISQLASFVANIKKIDLSSSQGLLASLLSLESRDALFQSYGNAEIIFSVQVLHNLIKNSYFSHKIQSLINNEISLESIYKIKGISNFNSPSLDEENYSLFVHAILKEFSNQHTIDFFKNQITNYEQITLD
ncbi:MAG: hypothetical protein VW397_05195 [Candidatus Margulisiibacteriota bacterium]